MRRTVLCILVILFALTLWSGSSPATADGDFERRLIELVNQERASRGLPPLTPHHLLTRAAQAHSQDMATNQFCGHDSSDGTPWYARIESFGYTPHYGLAENVGCGYATPEEMFAGWMGSPGHRANLLGDYEHVGVGYAYVPQGYRHYWTLDVARPAPDTPPPCALNYDFDGDGVLGVGDVAFLTERWHDDAAYDPQYDLDQDGDIDVVDVMLLITEWAACS